MNEKIELSLAKLIDWIEKNGWESYDPNDIKGHPLFVFLLSGKGCFKKISLYTLYSIYTLIPVYLRRIFKIKPAITAGGMGFLAAGFIESYKATGNPQSLKKAKQILDWLKENSLKSYDNYCWGFPFDWQSTTLIPKDTPIGYTIAECAKPFIEYYKISKDKEYLDVAVGACDFINENLNKKYHDDGSISFSYTPLDDAEVVNSNAIIAHVFFEVGCLTENEEFIEVADKIMQFFLREQLPDGSWYYYSYDFKSSPSVIDNFHTAMVLQSIWKIVCIEQDLVKKNACKKALIRGLEFYLDNFFTSVGMPKIIVTENYPADIASCAEAITIFSQLGIIKDELPSELSKRIRETNEKLILWTINNMQDPNGAFIERKYRFKKVKLHSIRWGQAFMLRALALSQQSFSCQS